MSPRQFLRIVWARRAIVLAAAISALLAALAATIVMPARTIAQARVMLDVVKPDPVTGQVITNSFARAYTRTQTEIIRDQRVAARAISLLGLRGVSPQDVAARTEARLIEGSNIIEIRHAGRSSEEARRMADALAQAYVDVSLGFRRQSAGRVARWYDAQAAKARSALAAADAAKTRFERQTGIILQDDKTDVDSLRLGALASQSPPLASASPGAAGTASAAMLQLAEIDAQLDEASRTLGPNHPQMIELQRRRAIIAQQAAADRAALSAAAGAAMRAAGAGAAALASSYNAQRARVILQRDKLEQARRLQAEVELRREQYARTAARAAELGQEAEVSDAGLTILGSAVAAGDPAFPRRARVLIAAIVFGAGFGLGLALLIELADRRVRGVEDLDDLARAPVFALGVTRWMGA